MDRPHTIPSRIVEKVQQTILRHGLLEVGDRIVVAVSGGADSMALLGLLCEMSGPWRWALAVAHLNHGLRGQEAVGDLHFVRRFAEKTGLCFFHRTLPGGALLAEHGSLQQAARRARYSFLEEIRSEFGAGKVALGHQADDQVETVLAALLRGAGTRGLSGMPYRRGPFVRPILDVTRREILAYVEARSIPFRRDSTNEKLVYRRNRIRHELLPYLRSRFNPGIDALLRQTAGICAAEDDYLDRRVRSLFQHTVREDVGILSMERGALDGCHRAIRWRLFRMLYAHVAGGSEGLGHVHLEAMDRLYTRRGRERRLDLPGGIRFIAAADSIMMGRPEAFKTGQMCHPVSIPGETRVPEAGLGIRWVVLDKGSLAGDGAGCHGVLMDPDGLRGRVVIRGPRAGDRLRPAGLGGTKKIQDILVDLRVPRHARWRVPLLVDEQGVVWVVGYRLDERVAVSSPGIRRVIKATVTPLGKRAGTD